MVEGVKKMYQYSGELASAFLAFSGESTYIPFENSDPDGLFSPLRCIVGPGTLLVPLESE